MSCSSDYNQLVDSSPYMNTDNIITITEINAGRVNLRSNDELSPSALRSRRCRRRRPPRDIRSNS